MGGHRQSELSPRPEIPPIEGRMSNRQPRSLHLGCRDGRRPGRKEKASPERLRWNHASSQESQFKEQASNRIDR